MVVLVMDAETFEWLRPRDAYIIKDSWADGLFTPVKFTARTN